MNEAHTGYNALETSLSSGNVGKLVQLWSFPTGGQIAAPIVVQDGIAFVNAADGYLYAVRAGTGAQVWRFRTFTDGQAQDSPIVSGAHVFVGCLVDGNAQQNGICALRISNGTLAWSYFLNCSCTPTAGLAAAPVVLGGTLLVPYYQSNAGGRSVLQVVNGDTGKPQWHYAYPAGNGGGPSPAAPAIANGAVYVGEQYSRSVCSVNLSSKAEDWCLPTGDDYNSLAVYKNVVYVNTYSHGVFAFNASNASQIWHYMPDAGNYSGPNDPPAIAKGIVYVAGIGFKGNLYALNASTGSLIYSTVSHGGDAEDTESSPSVANGVVYVGCRSGVCAFDEATGALLYAFGAPGSQQSTPAVVNGIVYATCGPNAACAYALAKR
jgi:eukaryotic-like serine/threonine-protein kinase